MKKTILTLVMPALFGLPVGSAPDQPSATGAPKKTVNVVSTAHLDTQWRWTIRTSIDEYIPLTFRENFKLMDKYPDYKFSFEGAFKYMLFKEYHPDEYAGVKKYIDRGQWRVAGSWVDPVDVNIPSFESLVRQALYGNGFFKQEFGRTSRDIFLPDCFGFGYALPSIAAHTGIKSFSTQKLSWGSAFGVPFDIGIWEGVDGSTLVAGIRPGSYGSEIKSDLSRDTLWLNRATRQGDSTGLYDAYMYIGTGDTGGSPELSTVDWLEKSIKSDGPLTVKSVGSDDLVDIVASAPNAHLKRYKGELLMTRHGVGCYTSQAAMKRWNRKNEQLADAAERAAAIATTRGGYVYPRQALKETWIRFLWHQFHDDLTGTSIPEAYEFSWNDEILCQNRFAAILENAVSASSRGLDTRGSGIPIVVFNPLATERADIVEATVLTNWNSKSLAVFGPDGKEVPMQVTGVYADSLHVQFLAQVPSVGYSVYDVRLISKPKQPQTVLAVSDSTLENQRYIVKLDRNGDVASIFDKSARRELLASPIQFELLNDKPLRWPAWEIQYEDIIQPPRTVVSGPAETRVIESGPGRAAIEVVRKSAMATYRSVISLAAGSDIVRFDCDVDWDEKESLLKAAFKFTTPNEKVTYDLGLGTIERGLNHKELYEVPGQQWADMTSVEGDYGVAVLNDCKYGWDHPDKETLRLTLIHTPGVFDDWSWVGDQSTQDLGHHKFSFAVMGHQGDWREGNVVWKAAELNQPLQAYQAAPHAGKLGKSYSMVKAATLKKGKPTPAKNIFINAVKMAENSDELIIRLRELNGNPAESIQIRFADPILLAREVNGVEDSLGEAVVKNGALITSLKSYQPRAFAVKLAARRGKPEESPVTQPLALPYDLDGISMDSDRKDGNLDGLGNSIAGDLLPDTVVHLGIPFMMGPKDAGSSNVVTCHGQKIQIPSGHNFKYIYALMTAVGGPTEGVFGIDDVRTAVAVQDYAEMIGQWNNRLVAGILVEDPEEIAPAYINRQPVAWYGSHRHNGQGENDTYQYTYLYLVRLNFPPGASTLSLPENNGIKLLAATAVYTDYDQVATGQPLYDVADAVVVKVHSDRKTFIDSAQVSLSSPCPVAMIHYTLDNSEPNSNSKLYSGPFFVDVTCTLKAAAGKPGGTIGRPASVKFRKLIPREPVQVAKTDPGIQCQYFEGSWSKLPDFDSLTVTKDTVTDSIAIPPFARTEDYGLRFIGYVNVSRDGMYEFLLDTDDGSVLYVSDSLVVNNDGIHGSGEVSGEIALKAGLHSIKVIMFQAKGDQALSVSVLGPELKKQKITKEMLSHEVATKKKGTSFKKSKL